MKYLACIVLIALLSFFLLGCRAVDGEHRKVYHHYQQEKCEQPEKLTPSERNRCYRLRWGP